MPVDFQFLFNVAITLLGGVVGWILNTVWGAVKDMQKADKELAAKVSAVEILVAGQYVKRTELNDAFARLEMMLSRIEDKLDSKADKCPGRRLATDRWLVAHRFEYLLEHCNTDHQRRVVELFIEGRTGPEIAEIIGGRHRSAPDRTLSRIKRRAARAGVAPGHFEHGVADGFRMGKVTVQRSGDGQIERTWERQLPDAEQILEIIEAAVDRLPDVALPAVKHDVTSDDDLLTVIPLGDPHFGLLTWEQEVGVNFDLEIAEAITFAAVDRLVAMSPPSGTAVLLNLGDMFHADNSKNATPMNGNPLDVDGRFEKIATTGILAMVRCVQRMLERHAKVIVRINKGNHDPHQAAMLALTLQAWFRENPRVEVDTSPSAFWYYRFGNVLIGSCHGDGPKLPDLPLIMATDKPTDWGECPFRVWHTGHVHHDSVKDYPGCSVETHRTLAPNDAWHKWKGFRSVRELKAINYHRERGEESRVRCGVQMLEALAA